MCLATTGVSQIKPEKKNKDNPKQTVSRTSHQAQCGFSGFSLCKALIIIKLCLRTIQARE